MSTAAVSVGASLVRGTAGGAADAGGATIGECVATGAGATDGALVAAPEGDAPAV